MDIDKKMNKIRLANEQAGNDPPDTIPPVLAIDLTHSAGPVERSSSSLSDIVISGIPFDKPARGTEDACHICSLCSYFPPLKDFSVSSMPDTPTLESIMSASVAMLCAKYP